MINWVDDVGAPLAVTAIDLTVETTLPEWDEWFTYGIVGLGYAGQFTRLGPLSSNFAKNMAIAAMPMAARKIYSRARGMSSPVRRLTARKVSRWPAPLVEEPFGGARLT